MRILRQKIATMKTSLSELTVAQKFEILKTVIVDDPNIVLSAARGHIYRCPNGHYYIIGECGGANQAGRCPDCGARIGGGSHRLAGNNVRINEREAQNL